MGRHHYGQYHQDKYLRYGMGKYGIKLYWHLSDEELDRLYDIGKGDGVLDIVAFDANVSREMFMMFTRRVEVFGAVYDECIPMGFFYLTSFEGGTARLHFCNFRAARPVLAELGRLVLDWCFETLEFQSLIGIVPSFNVGAIRFAREMGGREMGRIPGVCWMERLKRAVSGIQFLFLPPKTAAPMEA